MSCRKSYLCIASFLFLSQSDLRKLKIIMADFSRVNFQYFCLHPADFLKNLFKTKRSTEVKLYGICRIYTTLWNLKLCGFYRTAVCLVTFNKLLLEEINTNITSSISESNDIGYSSLNQTVTNSILDSSDIPIELDSSNNVPTQIHINTSTPRVNKSKPSFIPYKDGLETLRTLFPFAREIKDDIFIKNINRLKNTIKKWSKDNANQKKKYYKHFSQSEWNNLTEKTNKNTPYYVTNVF